MYNTAKRYYMMPLSNIINYYEPNQIDNNYKDYQETYSSKRDWNNLTNKIIGNENTNLKIISDIEKYNILVEFSQKLITDSKDIELEYLKIFNDNYDNILL